MTDKSGGPAFPTDNAPGIDPGISKRDYFASAALTGMGMWCPTGHMDIKVAGALDARAEWAYAQADAMLKAGGHVDD